MTVVGRGHERGITGTIFLGSSEDRTTVHLTNRQCLLQRSLLRRTDGLEFVEVDEEVVGQRHLLVELVREVQMAEEVLSQMGRQEATHEDGLSTALLTNQRWHTLIAVQHVHLEPMGYGRAEPDGEIVQLLGTDTRDSAEETGHVVLSVPLGQAVEVVLNRIVLRHLLRSHPLGDLRLRTALLKNLLTLGTNHDTVLGLWCERPEFQIGFIEAVRETVGDSNSVAFGSLGCFRQGRKLYLSIKHVAAEAVVLIEEHLDGECSLLADF